MHGLGGLKRLILNWLWWLSIHVCAGDILTAFASSEQCLNILSDSSSLCFEIESCAFSRVYMDWWSMSITFWFLVSNRSSFCTRKTLASHQETMREQIWNLGILQTWRWWFTSFGKGDSCLACMGWSEDGTGNMMIYCRQQHHHRFSGLLLYRTIALAVVDRYDNGNGKLSHIRASAPCSLVVSDLI